MMTGNCLGWVVYGYYQHDPFLVAANLPGLILSLWLNMGAAKLQYMDLMEARKERAQVAPESWDASPQREEENLEPPLEEALPIDALAMEDSLVWVPQERIFLKVVCFWGLILTYAGWFSTTDPASLIGIIVNLNLIFFYGAPLQTMQTVIRERTSESIHLPTMFMNYTNTSFWIAYGIARRDPVIILPNVVGLSLGLVQGVLCLLFPRTGSLSQVSLEETESMAGGEVS